MENKKNIIVLAVAVLLIIIGGVYYYRGKNSVQKACTEDAMICPDGSAVGRIGPNCEFAECPKDCIKEGGAVVIPGPGETAKQCCEGLVFAHTKDILSRDGTCQKP